MEVEEVIEQAVESAVDNQLECIVKGPAAQVMTFHTVDPYPCMLSILRHMCTVKTVGCNT
jgi:hypothetical protein